MLQKYPQFSFGIGNQGGSGVLDWGDTLGDSIYHSLQAKFEKRLTSRIYHAGFVYLGQVDHQR